MIIIVLFVAKSMKRGDDHSIDSPPDMNIGHSLKTFAPARKLDQGALGMSDPCGTLHLALKPYSVSRINCLLSNFYFCAY